MQDENDDYCSACGGNGELLCCDGCIRSFHFSCVDPPIDPDHPPVDDWFCQSCQAKKVPPPKRPRGLFSSVLDNLDKKNPNSFSLPRDIRDYFEGVKTGEEGEYEEAAISKAK
jgi:PHD-finger